MTKQNKFGEKIGPAVIIIGSLPFFGSRTTGKNVEKRKGFGTVSHGDAFTYEAGGEGRETKEIWLIKLLFGSPSHHPFQTLLSVLANKSQSLIGIYYHLVLST